MIRQLMKEVAKLIDLVAMKLTNQDVGINVALYLMLLVEVNAASQS